MLKSERRIFQYRRLLKNKNQRAVIKLSEKDNGSLNNKYLFEKLLEREDKFIIVIENLDDSIQSQKDATVALNETMKEYKTETLEKLNTIKKEVEVSKKGDRSLINTVFKYAISIIAFLAIGKETGLFQYFEQLFKK